MTPASCGSGWTRATWFSCRTGLSLLSGAALVAVCSGDSRRALGSGHAGAAGQTCLSIGAGKPGGTRGARVTGRSVFTRRPG